MSYTKGELRVTEHDGEVIIYDESDRVIAKMVDGEYEELRTNAQMFISAPKFYEACKELEPYFTWLEENKLLRITSLIKQALAKVERK